MPRRLRSAAGEATRRRPRGADDDEADGAGARGEDELETGGASGEVDDEDEGETAWLPSSAAAGTAEETAARGAAAKVADDEWNREDDAGTAMDMRGTREMDGRALSCG